MSAAIELEQLRARLAALFPGLAVCARRALWRHRDGLEREDWDASVQDELGIVYSAHAQPSAAAAFDTIFTAYVAKIDALESARSRMSEAAQ